MEEGYCRWILCGKLEVLRSVITLLDTIQQQQQKEVVLLWGGVEHQSQLDLMEVLRTLGERLWDALGEGDDSSRSRHRYRALQQRQTDDR